jgi:hypothetical protein
LPEERASARVVKFSFVAYGDTRSANDPNVPGDGRVIQAEHSRVVDRIITKARELAPTEFPVRFVLQSGDAVLRGTDAAMWNVSFNPIVERLTRVRKCPLLVHGRQSRCCGRRRTTTGPPEYVDRDGEADSH